MKVRVATVSLAGSYRRTVEGNREAAGRLVERAGGQGVDLVCLPEAFTVNNVPVRSVAEVAESVPGPTTAAFGELARRMGCYVVAPIYTHRDGRFWNSAVVLDRRGVIAWVYDKACPCLSDDTRDVFECGVTPGEDGPSHRDLDFGRVGIQICFEARFPERWSALGESGARLVLWPSAYHGGAAVQGYAAQHGYWVATAVRNGACRILDPCGRVAATSGPSAIAVADVELDYLLVQEEGNFALAAELRRRYGDRVRVEWSREEARMLVVPVDPGLTSAAVQREVGLEPSRCAVARHSRAYARACRRQTGLDPVAGSDGPTTGSEPPPAPLELPPSASLESRR